MTAGEYNRGVPVHINHAIVAASDKLASARYFTDLFGLAEPEEAGPFAVVRLDDGELLQFATPPTGEIVPIHLCFQVDDERFDALVSRLEALEQDHWADPRCTPARHQPQPRRPWRVLPGPLRQLLRGDHAALR